MVYALMGWQLSQTIKQLVQRVESRDGVLGEGVASRLPQASASRQRCKLPSKVQGQGPEEVGFGVFWGSKEMPFGGIDDIDPHLGGKNPKNNFGGVNKHFQAKLIKH